MFKMFKGTIGIALLLAGSMATMAQDGVTLRIGDPAPAFKSAVWFKGGPVDGLQKDRIYVLDFWATWCGPCRAAFPHLNKIARGHRDVLTVIAVNVLEGAHERETSTEVLNKRAGSFVASMAGKMDFSVCADTPDQSLYRAWMAASGMRGIPTTIIVDGSGRIAWIGHPVDDAQRAALDETLRQLLAGGRDYDYKKAAASFHSDAELQKEEEALMPIYVALQSGNYPAALDKTAEYTAAHPGSEMKVAVLKIIALAHTNEKAALETTEKFRLSMSKNDLLQLSYALAADEKLPKTMVEIAGDLGEQLLKKDPGNWMVMATLAKTNCRLGNAAKAIDMQKRALEGAKADPAGVPAEQIGRMEQELKAYQGH
jgi:thiol-disulfide isomerase/thioredoxin